MTNEVSKRIYAKKTVYKGEFGNYVTEWNQESILLSILAQFQGYGMGPEIKAVGKEGFELTLDDSGNFNGNGAANKLAQEKEILDKLRFNFHVKNITKSSAYCFNEDSLKESNIVGDRPTDNTHDDWEYENIGGMPSETPQAQVHGDQELACPGCGHSGGDFVALTHDENPTLACPNCQGTFVMTGMVRTPMITTCSSCGSDDLEQVDMDNFSVLTRCASCDEEVREELDLV